MARSLDNWVGVAVMQYWSNKNLIKVTRVCVINDYLIVLQDLSEIGIAIELMHIQPPGRHFDSSLFYKVGHWPLLEIANYSMMININF